MLAGVTGDAIVQAAAVVVVALVGGALAGMRGWAKGVERKIEESSRELDRKLDEGSRALTARVDLVAAAVEGTRREQSRQGERLAAVETAIRLLPHVPPGALPEAPGAA